jgi:purine-binding chemotaxis protein CheW
VVDVIRLVILMLDGRRYGLRLSAVERVIPAIEIVPLPQAPEIVLGVINVQGQIIPVMDIRRRFRLPPRAMAPSDHLIIARTARRTVALLADRVVGPRAEADLPFVAAAEILPDMAYVEGVLALDDGVVFVHDLDAFLSLEEEGHLAAAMAANRAEAVT